MPAEYTLHLASCHPEFSFCNSEFHSVYHRQTAILWSCELHSLFGSRFRPCQTGLSPCAQNPKRRTPVFSMHSTNASPALTSWLTRFRCIIALPAPGRYRERLDPPHHAPEQPPRRVRRGENGENGSSWGKRVILNCVILLRKPWTVPNYPITAGNRQRRRPMSRRVLLDSAVATTPAYTRCSSRTILRGPPCQLGLQSLGGTMASRRSS